MKYPVAGLLPQSHNQFTATFTLIASGPLYYSTYSESCQGGGGVIWDIWLWLAISMDFYYVGGVDPAPSLALALATATTLNQNPICVVSLGLAIGLEVEIERAMALGYWPWGWS